MKEIKEYSVYKAKGDGTLEPIMTTEEKKKLLAEIEAKVYELDDAICDGIARGNSRLLARQSNAVLNVKRAIDSLKYEL